MIPRFVASIALLVEFSDRSDAVEGDKNGMGWLNKRDVCFNLRDNKLNDLRVEVLTDGRSGELEIANGVVDDGVAIEIEVVNGEIIFNKFFNNSRMVFNDKREIARYAHLLGVYVYVYDIYYNKDVFNRVNNNIKEETEGNKGNKGNK